MKTQTKKNCKINIDRKHKPRKMQKTEWKVNLNENQYYSVCDPEMLYSLNEELMFKNIGTCRVEGLTLMVSLPKGRKDLTEAIQIIEKKIGAVTWIDDTKEFEAKEKLRLLKQKQLKQQQLLLAQQQQQQQQQQNQHQQHQYNQQQQYITSPSGNSPYKVNNSPHMFKFNPQNHQSPHSPDFLALSQSHPVGAGGGGGGNAKQNRAQTEAGSSGSPFYGASPVSGTWGRSRTEGLPIFILFL